jgi:acyl-CoA synthetase (AMP-forming)/AMP-acid ligase II
MDGYLHADAAPRRWRTGDMGSLDPDGFLRIHGRCDNLILTPYGRNVNPEWIETMLMGNPNIGASILCQVGSPVQLTVLLIPSRVGDSWFKTASECEILSLVARGCEAAPEYARPEGAIVVSREEAVRRGLFTSSGRIKRSEAARYVHDKAAVSRCTEAVEEER